jgi:hypothetical protein
MADLVISVQGAERAQSSAAFMKSIDWNVEAFLDVDDLRVTSIYSSLSSLYKSERFTDITICCGGRRFKVHRAIVCPQCPFFDKAMSGAFMVSFLMNPDHLGFENADEHRKGEPKSSTYLKMTRTSSRSYLSSCTPETTPTN